MIAKTSFFDQAALTALTEFLENRIYGVLYAIVLEATANMDLSVDIRFEGVNPPDDTLQIEKMGRHDNFWIRELTESWGRGYKFSGTPCVKSPFNLD